MDKTKISIEQKKSTKTGSTTKLKRQAKEYDPKKDLLDERLIAMAVWECLKENDPNGVVEILEAHLKTRNQSLLAKECNLPRTTLYHAFRGKNPTLHTLAKLIHAI